MSTPATTEKPDGADPCGCGLWICIICRPPGHPQSPFIDGYFTQHIRRELIADKLKEKTDA